MKGKFNNHVCRKLASGGRLRVSRFDSVDHLILTHAEQVILRESLCGFRAAARRTDSAIKVKTTDIGDWESGVRNWRRVNKENRA